MILLFAISLPFQSRLLCTYASISPASLRAYLSIRPLAPTYLTVSPTNVTTDHPPLFHVESAEHERCYCVAPNISLILHIREYPHP